VKHFLGLAVLLAFVSGCSIHQYIYEPEDIRHTVSDTMTERERDLLEIPFEATPDMMAFAEDAAGDAINPIDKSIRIVDAIMSRWILDVRYERAADFTAQDIFHHTRRANCLSFTHLFVSLARSINIRAHYVDVAFEDQITEKGVIISNHHICAGVYDGAEFFLIDFAPRPQKSYRVYRLIDDLEATANHYNNLAINEYAVHRETLKDALTILDMALSIKPEFLRALNNKVAVLALMDRMDEAEAVYRHALAIDSDMPEANANLAGLLLKRGKSREAIHYSHRAVKQRPQNIEYRYRYALANLYMGNYHTAYKQFRWITRRDPSMTDAFRGVALALYHLEEFEESRDALQRALLAEPESGAAHTIETLLHREGY